MLGKRIVKQFRSDWIKYGFTLHTGLQFNLDVEPFPEAETIINKQLENVELRFKLHNRITFRGRVSSLQVNLLNNLLEENLLLIKQLQQVLDL